ncbi:PREDICTED: uncharacterized protein LOC106809345 isoform X2 [Priapulus caudatus]|nr:PREDICTED: uncharacterized protein LOC106809345 isoform X2 [Priapulus caudatus]
MQKVVAMNNDHRARSRHQTAMQLLHNENETRNKLQNQRIIFRKSALEVEKARASAIASRTIPIDSVKEALQSTSDIGSEIEVQNSAISYTFNMQGSATVAKATCIHEEPDAIQAAVIEDRLVKQQKELAAKASIDQCGKANIRFKIALRDELMKQHCGRIMADMHGLHQTDRQQKQATVSKIPKFISQLTDGNQRTQQQHHPHPEIGFAGALATEHPDSSLELLEDLGKRMSFHATGSNTTSKQCQYRQSQGDALNKMICNVNKQRIAWVEQAGHHPISPFKRNAHFKGHNSNISDPQFATESAETPCSPAEYNSRAVDGRTSTHLLPHLIGNVNGKTIDCLPQEHQRITGWSSPLYAMTADLKVESGNKAMQQEVTHRHDMRYLGTAANVCDYRNNLLERNRMSKQGVDKSDETKADFVVPSHALLGQQQQQQAAVPLNVRCMQQPVSQKSLSQLCYFSDHAPDSHQLCHERVMFANKGVSKNGVGYTISTVGNVGEVPITCIPSNKAGKDIGAQHTKRPRISCTPIMETNNTGLEDEESITPLCLQQLATSTTIELPQREPVITQVIEQPLHNIALLHILREDYMCYVEEWNQHFIAMGLQKVRLLHHGMSSQQQESCDGNRIIEQRGLKPPIAVELYEKQSAERLSQPHLLGSRDCFMCTISNYIPKKPHCGIVCYANGKPLPSFLDWLAAAATPHISDNQSNVVSFHGLSNSINTQSSDKVSQHRLSSITDSNISQHSIENGMQLLQENVHTIRKLFSIPQMITSSAMAGGSTEKKECNSQLVSTSIKSSISSDAQEPHLR